MYPSLYSFLTPNNFDNRAPYDRFGPVVYDRHISSPPSGLLERLAWEVKAVDHYEDLEFVFVRGEEDRDDPHRNNVNSSLADCDDNMGEIWIDGSWVGRGRISQLFGGEGGARYTLEFEVRRGSNPYELVLHLYSFRCENEQSGIVEGPGSDEVYILVNGRKVWRQGSVDSGDRFDINQDIPFYYRACLRVYEEDEGACPKATDDVAHHLEENNDFLSATAAAWLGLGSHNFTAFLHFIDIKKGRGTFDDYDGYSYEKGSGRAAQDERATYKNEAGPIDEVINWWYNDEYVHIRDYYPESYNPETCAPATERYSEYSTGSLRDRFPLAESTGKRGMGIPYSVFPPVDNMARYWFEAFCNPPAGYKPNLPSLGPVLHAIQDASVPHHACGFLGNYHGDYEGRQSEELVKWLLDSGFRREVKSLVQSWDVIDPAPPAAGSYHDYGFYLGRNPAINWSVDQLVTWMAVHAYNAMPNGGIYNSTVARDLSKKALALSVLVLKKAISCVYPYQDFVLNASCMTWQNDQRVRLSFPGSDTDSRGFVLIRPSAVLEDGRTYQNVLETHPRWAANGSITGTSCPITIPANAVFKAQVGFLQGATATDGATFIIEFIPETAPAPTVFVLARVRASYDGRLDSINIDLSRFAGQTGRIRLTVQAGDTSTQDWAVWVNPRIESIIQLKT